MLGWRGGYAPLLRHVPYAAHRKQPLTHRDRLMSAPSAKCSVWPGRRPGPALSGYVFSDNPGRNPRYDATIGHLAAHH